MKCGGVEFYDRQYDRVTTKNEKHLKRINRVFHSVTTTDDPVIRKVWFVSGLLHGFTQPGFVVYWYNCLIQNSAVVI